ncbi:MAG: cytochrome c peroxidase, partial [Planctomycetota bacterium]
IDLRKRKLDSNSFLDEVSRGAANPWGVAYASGGGTICVAHSGTHELSVIETERMLEEIRFFTQQLPPMNGDNVIRECRRRVKLPGNGPRDLVVVGSKAYVSEYFSDMISVVDLDAVSEDYAPSTILLGPEPRMSKARRGEMLFHDATFCYQHWQSCASCHTDGRSDALNWDLLNDEAGTPRNTKSLLYAHRTPPAMVTGVRATAEVAVRAGIKHILFVYDDEDTEDEAQAIDAYLKSLRPVPSPYLVDGRPSDAARRGEEVFGREEVGCATCHPPPLYTDRRLHEVLPPPDYGQREFDTPMLVEIWRTAPYLNDGRFATLKELLVKGKHGSSSGGVEDLTEREIEDLVEFLLSL